nr:MAG TPA: hypothetical protein [Crassvirales sp.]
MLFMYTFVIINITIWLSYLIILFSISNIYCSKKNYCKSFWT